MDLHEKHVCMLSEVPEGTDLPPTATYKQFFVCLWRATCVASAWHAGAARDLRSSRRLRTERARPASRLHAYSVAAFALQTWHLALTLLLLVYLPFQVFVSCPNPYNPLILFCDVMSLLNIFVTFNTGYVTEDSKFVVLEPKLIALHYLKTTFIPDLIGSMPLQLIVPPFEDCQYPSHTVMFLFKLFRLVTMMKGWKGLLEQLGLSYVKKQVATDALNVMLFFHWMTFIHHQVPTLVVHYYPADQRNKVRDILFKGIDVDSSSVVQKYTANLFLVCGLCIGAGYFSQVEEHYVSELLLTSMMGIVGIVFLTYSFSIVLRLAIYMQAHRNSFNGRLNELNRYMMFKRLPQSLQRKIKLFINYKFNGQLYDEQKIMNTINEQIKQDINMYSCKQLVSNVPLFQDMPIALINAIIFNLTQVLYMPGEVLVRNNEEGTTLFIISSGTVAVMNSNGRELAHLRDGSYFGKTALLKPGTPRNATIIALEITETYRLESRDFQTNLLPYPHIRRRLEENFLKRRINKQDFC